MSGIEIQSCPACAKTWYLPRQLCPGCGHASPDPSCCNSGCKPCASPLLHYGPTPCKSPRPDWRAYWATTFATLQPYIANRSVIGVNLNDEMM